MKEPRQAKGMERGRRGCWAGKAVRNVETVFDGVVSKGPRAPRVE